jgi:hypothetical protein
MKKRTGQMPIKVAEDTKLIREDAFFALFPVQKKLKN